MHGKVNHELKPSRRERGRWIMAKSQERVGNKNSDKKKPMKTLQEKRKAKQEKKVSRGW